MATAPEETFDKSLMQPHYAFIKSINNDLVLLGNALMTKNNDINSIHDFVSDSINTLESEKLRSKMHELNNQVIGCDNDEDRLKLLVRMQYALAEASIPYIGEHHLAPLQELKARLKKVQESENKTLKSDVSLFQIDILKFVPRIEEQDHKKLVGQAHTVFENEGKDLLQNINVLYEDINLLIQPPFDEF